MIVAGASSYSRSIDFKKFREIADEVNAYLFVDMAHIAGLVAAGLHMNPVDYADVVTSTTHKTLRGPRGGIILTNNELANIKALSNYLISKGVSIISSGTDNHLIVIDVYSSFGITGKEAEEVLDLVNITVNKNTIPSDKFSPLVTSGIRIGSPAMTTRGLKEDDFVLIGEIIYNVLSNYGNSGVLETEKIRVHDLTSKYKMYD